MSRLNEDVELFLNEGDCYEFIPQRMEVLPYETNDEYNQSVEGCAEIFPDAEQTAQDVQANGFRVITG